VIVNRLDRKKVSLTVTATLANGTHPTLSSVDLIILPLYRKPNAETAWVTVPITGSTATFFLSGPDADLAGDLSVPDRGGDAWARVVDNGETDVKFVERIELH
jgi:hypothetical protein